MSDQVIDSYFIYSDLEDIELSETEQILIAQGDAMAEQEAEYENDIPLGKVVL